MAESDSPLSTTSSIIAILTLVYALTITLQIYVTALYRSERETEALAQRLGHGEYSIKEMRIMLERFVAAHGYYSIDSFEQSHGNPDAQRVWKPQLKQDGPALSDRLTLSEDLRILIDKIKAAQDTWSACVSNWESFQNDLKDAHWGVFGSAKYAPILHPLWGIIGWPLAFHRTFSSCMVQTALSTLLWLIAIVLVVPLGSIWLTCALLYNLFVLMYNGLVWLDMKHLVQRLRWTRKQEDIARRMQDVELTIADLRMRVLVR